MIMNVLMLLKCLEKGIIVPQYFKSEDEAIHWWSRLPSSDEWEIIYLKERGPSGHRYELSYTKFDERGVLYSKYIICFSKKEALYLKNKIERVNQNYIIQIKKLY